MVGSGWGVWHFPPIHSFLFTFSNNWCSLYCMRLSDNSPEQLGRINQVKLHIKCLIREACTDHKVKFLWHFKGIARALMF